MLHKPGNFGNVFCIWMTIIRIRYSKYHNILIWYIFIHNGKLKNVATRNTLNGLGAEWGYRENTSLQGKQTTDKISGVRLNKNLGDLLNFIFNFLYGCCFDIWSKYFNKSLLRINYLSCLWSLQISPWNYKLVVLNLK